MPIKQVLANHIGQRCPVKVWTEDFGLNTAEQLVNTASLPFIHRHVAGMPDVHQGLGATVGSVVPTKGAIIPAAVGVDIGCGMMASRLDIRATGYPTTWGQCAAPSRLPCRTAAPITAARTTAGPGATSHPEQRKRGGFSATTLVGGACSSGTPSP